jgi:hypothetical protein
MCIPEATFGAYVTGKIPIAPFSESSAELHLSIREPMVS